MRITLLSLEYPPHVYGGAGVHVHHLSRELAREVSVEVRTLGDGPLEVVEGVEVRRYRPPLPVAPGPIHVLETLSWDLALVAEPIQGDIIHAHTWYTDFAGFLGKQLYGKPLVATVHSLEPLRPWKEEGLGRGYRVSTWMERTGLEACDRIVAVSRAMKEDLQSAYSIPSGRITVIHNGIDHQRYRPVHGPETLRLLGVRKPYILFVGRLTKAKGIVDLLEASRHLPRRLQVVCVTGRPDAPGSEEAMTRAVAASPNVLWIPRMLSEEETIHLYTDCEAFVCPSIYEPFGITNLEAMACGRPVVATRVGGIPEVVLDGETGLLVPPSNPGALAEAIEGLLADPERAGAMGVAGRRRVEEHFGWHSVALRTLQLYREVLAGSDLSIDPRPQAE